MRWLVRLGWVFGALFVLLVFAGLALPREYRVERAVETSASADRVHRLAADLSSWPLWAGDPSGIEIVDLDPELGIEYEQKNAEGEVVRRGALRYDALDETTRVTWLVVGDHGPSTIDRFRSFSMEWREGPRLEEGLARLAGLVESLPGPAAAPPVAEDQSSAP